MTPKSKSSEQQRVGGPQKPHRNTNAKRRTKRRSKRSPKLRAEHLEQQPIKRRAATEAALALAGGRNQLILHELRREIDHRFLRLNARITGISAAAFRESPAYNEMYALAGAPSSWPTPTPYARGRQIGVPYHIVTGYATFTGSSAYSTGVEGLVFIPTPWDMDNPITIFGTAAGGTAQSYDWSPNSLTYDNPGTKVAALKDTYGRYGSWAQGRSPVRFHCDTSLANNIDASTVGGYVVGYRPCVQVLGGQLIFDHSAAYNATGHICPFSPMNDRTTHGFSVGMTVEEQIQDGSEGTDGLKFGVPIPHSSRASAETLTVKAFMESVNPPLLIAGSSTTATGRTVITLPNWPGWMTVGRNSGATDATRDSTNYGQSPWANAPFDILTSGGIRFEPTAGTTGYTVTLRVVMAVAMAPNSSGNVMSYSQMESRKNASSTKPKAQDDTRFWSIMPQTAMHSDATRLLDQPPGSRVPLHDDVRALVARANVSAQEDKHVSATAQIDEKPSFWSKVGNALKNAASETVPGLVERGASALLHML
jgi:hypothetical protein